jgi:hypothetical protein
MAIPPGDSFLAMLVQRSTVSHLSNVAAQDRMISHISVQAI